MYEDWDFNAPAGHFTRARDINAALRAAQDAEDANWEAQEDLDFHPPFDPKADELA